MASLLRSCRHLSNEEQALEKHHTEEFLRQAEQAKAQVKMIAATEVDAARASGAVVIDVRDADEHTQAHIPGAVNISLKVLVNQAEQALPDKDALIICYCNGGNRGALGAATLNQLGFTNVHSIAGGFRAYAAR